MRGYKWLTLKRQTFYTGEVLNYGWHKQDGPADGLVCRDGGFHIFKTSLPPHEVFAKGAKINPNYSSIGLFAVDYRKRDILGQDRKGKLRVRAFKLLKKDPVQKMYPNHDTTTSSTGLNISWPYNFRFA